MKLSKILKKTSQKNYILLHEASNTHQESIQQPTVPKGLMKRCNACKSAILSSDVEQGYYICPKCNHYFRMQAFDRIEMVADAGTFEQWDEGLTSGNPLKYKGYEEKVESLRQKTGLDEAVITGRAKIDTMPVVLAVCDGRFMMASMGKVVGEKITRAVERATREKLPLIIFACSGGARMQEGIHSLMQMAKTSAALKRHHEAGLLYISVLTDPTTGGVTASFAMLGDIILAEPKALIGFAGPRVIEQTIGQKLPKGFQRSEFLLKHGFIDRIVEREEMKNTLSLLLKLHVKGEVTAKDNSYKVQDDVKEDALSIRPLPAWERVLLSRKKTRPVGEDYIQALFQNYIEMHGDRYFGDDGAIVGGIAFFNGLPVTVIAQEKGRSTKDNIKHNFGMPSPEGYRKALRLMKQAEKFKRPIICFVDTPGAFCGLEAEERGQGEAIARNLFELSGIQVPILSVIIGEGGSGGALAMAVADEVWILENAIYSILSPEGFASILWKDSKKAKEAADVMKLTADHLYRGKMVERILPEPEEYTVESMGPTTDKMHIYIQDFLEKYCSLDAGELLDMRYERFRKM